MIFIDLENKLPTDIELPETIRWSQVDWSTWQTKSMQLVRIPLKVTTRTA